MTKLETAKDWLQHAWKWFLLDSFAIKVTALFLLLQAIVVRSHEMWRDEIQAWLFARDSSNVVDLMQNLRYEGHPPLWHSMLYVASQFTDNPLAMQVLHVIIAATTVFIFVRFAPFHKLYRFFFAFGYLMFYEYGVIARNYNLIVLLLVLFCVLVTRQRKNYIAIGINLLLLTQVHALGVMLLPALGLYVFWDFLENRKRQRLPWKALFICGGIAAAGLVAFVLETIKPADSSVALFRVADIRNTIATLWWGMAPVPARISNFWGTNIVSLIDQATLLGLLLLTGMVLFFYRNLKLLATYLLGTTILCSFFYFKNLSSIRSHGLLFMLFIACAWILYYEQSKVRKKQHQNWFYYQQAVIGIVLFLQFFGLAVAVKKELSLDFSRGERTAQYIEQHNLSDLPIVGTLDYTTSTLLGYLGTDAYYAQSRVWGSYVIWNDARMQSLTEQEAVDIARMISREKGSDALLITPSPLSPELARQVTYVEGFAGPAVVADESYFLYRVSGQ